MSEPYVYKPQTRKGPVIILPNDTSTPPTITLSDGKVITAVKGDRAGGVYKGHEGYQWVFPNDVLGQEDATLTVDGKTQELGNTNMSYRGSSLGSLSPSSNGAIGSTATGPGGSGPFGPYTPGKVGDFGVTPAFLGNQFPNPVQIPGAAPTYQYVDPIKFGEQFNPFARSELKKNLDLSRGFALDTIDTEFQGLQNYVPRSAELKRTETAKDTVFNQALRTAQVNQAVPDVVADLQSNAEAYRSYARGEVPNAAVDRALELGTRSAAADIASTSGFGVGSSAARKLSDLMSAKDRIQLSQFGLQGLSQNAAERTNLLLAPTAYSNAGQQVNVMPSLSPSQLSQSIFGSANTATGIPASTAFTSNIQQSQFLSNLVQRTQEVNATSKNDFALSLFNYLNSYANSVAGGYQNDINTQIRISQQNTASQVAANAQTSTQNSNMMTDIIKGLGSLYEVIKNSTKTGGDLPAPEILGAERVPSTT